MDLYLAMEVMISILWKILELGSYSSLGYTYIPIVGTIGSAEALSHLAYRIL